MSPRPLRRREELWLRHVRWQGRYRVAHRAALGHDPAQRPPRLPILGTTPSSALSGRFGRVPGLLQCHAGMTSQEIAEVRPRLAAFTAEMLGDLPGKDQRTKGELFARR